MSNTSSYHPAELATVLSYMRVNAVIGWGPLAPEENSDAFYEDGTRRLQLAKRLLPGKQEGRYRFAEATSRIAATLGDPQIVLLTQRREGAGARIMTHHTRGTNVVELSKGTDGNFQVVEHEALAGAGGAAAAFVGASASAVETPARIETDRATFEHFQSEAKHGSEKAAQECLVKLGATEAEARSAVSAFRAPTACGVISIMYCVGNATVDAEAYAVFTNAADESWVAFPPASADGPMVLERTSLGALTARILVTVAAKMMEPA